MAHPIALKPTSAPVRAYYLALAQLANVGAKHETAVREAWHTLIEHCAGPLKWTLVREYSVSRKGAAPPAASAPVPAPASYTQADLDAGHIYAKEDPPKPE